MMKLSGLQKKERLRIAIFCLEGNKDKNNCLVSTFYGILNFRALLSHLFCTEKRAGNFKNPVKITHKAVLLVFLSL